MEPTNQITSEKILQQSYASKQKILVRPTQTIQDLDELRSYQLRKRKEFEQQLNKNRLNFGQWLRYAKWEAQENHDYERARSIYERALDVNIQHIPFWVHYIQFELVHKAINHARNLLDRATTTLPRVNKLWFLYVQTEETLKNYSMVRKIFDRWLSWKPDNSAWDAYINFEIRYNEVENARNIFIKYVRHSSGPQTWLKWVDFEIDQANNIGNIRYVFELAANTLISSHQPVTDIITKWTNWEVSLQEYERARAIYQLLIEEETQIKLLKQERTAVYNSFTEFEKVYGDKSTIESSVVVKRKLEYELTLESDLYDYDTWWSYINLLQQTQQQMSNEKFEAAVANVPKDLNKTIAWRRYVFIWIRYCFWEEFTNKNIATARELWGRCVDVISKTTFTFAKVWIEFAKFEIRNNSSDQLLASRKLLGLAIGKTSKNGPKPKLFKYYIELETRLGEWNRVRKLYERWLELLIVNQMPWTPTLIEYVQFENSISEPERCVSLYEFGISLQEELGMNDIAQLWYSYIDYNNQEMNYNQSRELYKRVIKSIDSVTSWINYAIFESSIPTEEQLNEFNQSEQDELQVEVTDEHREATRKVFKDALKYYQQKKLNDERVLILEAWLEYERVNGNDQSQQEVERLKPTITKTTKLVNNEEVEHIEYDFPSIEPQPTKPNISKFLANAIKFSKSS
jgi:crooked neck